MNINDRWLIDFFKCIKCVIK